MGTAQCTSSRITTSGPEAVKCSQRARAPASAASALVSSPRAGASCVERFGPVCQVTQREERDALAVGHARRFEHHGGHVINELRDQATFADSGLAHHDCVTRPAGVDNEVESTLEVRQFGRPPDERSLSHGRARAARPDTEQAALGVQLERVTAKPCGGDGHEDLARRRVPHRGACLTDDGSHEHRAAVLHEQSSRADGEAGVDVDSEEDLAQLDPRPRRPQHVVFVCALDAEAREQLQP